MAVEKLAHAEFAKIGSRQEALQTIFPSLLDIFYNPIFDFFKKNRVFQQPQDFSTSIRVKPSHPICIVSGYATSRELTRNRRVGQRERGPHESFSLVSPYSSVSKPRGDSPS